MRRTRMVRLTWFHILGLLAWSLDRVATWSGPDHEPPAPEEPGKPSDKDEPREIAMTEPQRGPSPRPPRRASLRGFELSFGLVSGVLVGVGSFYTAYFRGFLQTTTAVVGLLLAAMFIVALFRVVRQYEGSSLRALRSPAGIVSILSVVLLVPTVFVGVRPPAVVPVPPSESCTYDVKTQTPVPLVPGGSIQQFFTLEPGDVNAISVIPGLDDRVSDLDREHLLRLRFRVPDQDIDVVLGPHPVVNNGYTRFNLANPVDLPRRSRVSLQVFNDSDEIVSVYIKRPDPDDIIDTDSPGAFIRGHADQEQAYTFTGSFLSGCVATT